MKKIIAITALIASMQASAFWGWNDSYNNGYFDGIGAADANGYGYGTGRGHGYNAHAPYYGALYGYVPMAPVEATAK